MSIHHAQRVQVKLYAERPEPNPSAFVRVFHRWIREDAIEGELLVDVADYSHVHHGPGVVLIGHGSDLAYDQGEGRPGLLFSRKRAFDGGLRARLTDALTRALDACARLEADDEAEVVFSRSELLVRVPDRLHAPNEDAAHTALHALVTEVLRTSFGSQASCTRAGAAGDPLSARVRLDGALAAPSA